MIDFRKKMQEQLQKMEATGILFRADITGRDVWYTYLNAFTPEDDPIFRDPESTTHNCNLCNNFLRRYGNIIAIAEDGSLMTLFDFDLPGEYQNSIDALQEAIRGAGIGNVFFETYSELQSLPYEKVKKTAERFQLGIETNYKRYNKEEAEKFGVVKKDEDRTFNHMALKLHKNFVDQSGKSIEAIMAFHRDNKNVLERGMKEIPLDTLLLVRDLINQESLLDGKAHLSKLETFIDLKKAYDQQESYNRDSWLWRKSHNLGIAKFKNELIGVLCTELAEGEEINKACQSWNKRVDPVNYMKAKAPITQKQINEAKKFVEENGYESSFNRRVAKIDDIKASEIKHMNVGDGKMASVSIFDKVPATKSRHKRNEFEGVEEVNIEKFMTDILPSCSGVELFLQNNHEGHMVTMTTSAEEESKPIFKWANNYSWTFNGNLAGKSQIKDAVAGLGGKVDGVLRFSIMWAEGDKDNSDLDAHCIEPNGNRIYFSRKTSQTGGNLDIDIQAPQRHKKGTGKNVVENITYPNLDRMPDGKYEMIVHQYTARYSQGFKAEIEFDGELFSYSYDKPVSDYVTVAEVTKKGSEFTINHRLPESNASKEVYGLDTNQFHKVELVCLSPNHWGENNVGNKHYFFMLEGCQAPTSLRGFHNENLIPELRDHRKVMEVLASTQLVEPAEKQLSGLGFNATVRDEVILKLSGNFKRVIKLKF